MPLEQTADTAFFDALLAGTAFNDSEPAQQQNRNGPRPASFDAIAFLKNNGVRVASTKQDSFGTKYGLTECPFDPSHRAPDSYVTVSDKGIIFHCSHNSCAGKKWQDVRLLFEPGYGKPHQVASRTAGTKQIEADDSPIVYQ